MNRAYRAGLALAVGFVGATAAVQALEQSSFDDPEYVGTPDFFDYCREAFGETAAALRHQPGASGWRCAARPEGLFRLLPVDVDDMCVRQFGAGAFARSTDPDDAESWQCLRG